MTVAELIEYLKTLKQDEVVYLSNDYWMGAGPVGKLTYSKEYEYSDMYGGNVPYGDKPGYFWGV